MKSEIKRIFTIFLIVLLLIGCNRETKKNKSETKINVDEIVEVYNEPLHKLVFEKGYVKILDVQIKPQDTSLFHWHRNPMFTVSLGFQNGARQLLNSEWIHSNSVKSIGRIGSKTSFLDEPLVHRITNRGTIDSRLIGILNTGIGLSSNIDSTEYELSNKWFRAKRIVLNSGDNINYQKLLFPTILILVSGNEIEIIKDDQHRVVKNKWLFLEEKNQLINSNDTKIEIIQVEVLN